jgi:hypothetical protein
MATLLKRGLTTDVEMIVVSLAGPASYATGGFDMGFPTSGAPILVVGDNNGGYEMQYDYTNKKMKAFRNAGINLPHVEETAAVNLSTFTFRATAFWLP